MQKNQLYRCQSQTVCIIIWGLVFRHTSVISVSITDCMHHHLGPCFSTYISYIGVNHRLYASSSGALFFDIHQLYRCQSQTVCIIIWGLVFRHTSVISVSITDCMHHHLGPCFPTYISYIGVNHRLYASSSGALFSDIHQLYRCQSQTVCIIIWGLVFRCIHQLYRCQSQTVCIIIWGLVFRHTSVISVSITDCMHHHLGPCFSTYPGSKRKGKVLQVYNMLEYNLSFKTCVHILISVTITTLSYHFTYCTYCMNYITV